MFELFSQTIKSYVLANKMVMKKKITKKQPGLDLKISDIPEYIF